MSDLKVGDQLAFRNNYHGYEIHEINKITPSGRINCGTTRTGQPLYTLNADLTLRGRGGVGSWNLPYKAEVVTDEILTSILRKTVLYKLENIKWREYTTDNLQAVLGMLPRVEVKK